MRAADNENFRKTIKSDEYTRWNNPGSEGEKVNTLDNLRYFLFVEIDSGGDENLKTTLEKSQQENFNAVLAEIYLDHIQLDSSDISRGRTVNCPPHLKQQAIDNQKASCVNKFSQALLNQEDVKNFFLSVLLEGETSETSFTRAYQTAKRKYAENPSPRESSEIGEHIRRPVSGRPAAGRGAASAVLDPEDEPTTATATQPSKWWEDDLGKRDAVVTSTINDNDLAVVVNLWTTFKDQSGAQPYQAVKFKLDSATGAAVKSSRDGKTEIKLKAEITKSLANATPETVDINLTLQKDSTSNNVTMTCSAKDIPEELQYQLIAAQFLALRKQGMSDDDAKKVEICEFADEVGKRNVKNVNRFNYQGTPGAPGGTHMLSDKEAMVIAAHLKSGYTEVTYKGNVYTGIKTEAVSVSYVSPVVAVGDGAAKKQMRAVKTKTTEAIAAVAPPPPSAAAAAAVDEAVEDKDSPSSPEGNNVSGKFIPCRVAFSAETGDAERQAKEILTHMRTLKNKGYERVGITYAANTTQSENITAANGKAKSENEKGSRYSTGLIKGANQAEVMEAAIKLVNDPDGEFFDLADVFYIIPIATMEEGKPTAEPAASIVTKNLEHAGEFLKNGGVLLGWQNQNTPEGEYAIGGGVAGKLSEAHATLIQGGLSELAKDYPVVPLVSASTPAPTPGGQ